MPTPLLLAVLFVMMLLFEITVIPALLSLTPGTNFLHGTQEPPPAFVALNPSSVIPSTESGSTTYPYGTQEPPPAFVTLKPSSVIPSTESVNALSLPPASTTGLPLPVSTPRRVSFLFTYTCS